MVVFGQGPRMAQPPWRTTLVLLTPLLALCACSSGTSHPTGATSGPPARSLSAPPSVGATPAPAQQSAVAVESNPPGDIADNLAYVPYSNAAGGYRFVHPEGWTQLDSGRAVTLTGKLSGVHAEPGPRTNPPTLDQGKADAAALASSEAAFELRSVAATSLPGGTGVLIVYRRNSDPDPVTGRQYRDEVQRYEVVHAGHEVVLELFGPVGSDNVDAYRKISQSLQIG